MEASRRLFWSLDLASDLTYWNKVRIPNVEAFKLLSDELILMHSDPLKVLSHRMACDVEVREGRIAAVRSAPAFV